MAEVIMWDLPTILIFCIALCVLIYGGFLYLAKGREKEASNERIVMFGYSGILFCFACELIFYLLFLFFLPGVYRDNAFYVNLRNVDDSIFILFGLTALFYFLGQLLFIFVFELNFKRTRYLLTIIGIFMILLFFMVPLESYLVDIPYSYLLILVYLVIITYAKWSQVEYRIISSYILMGFYGISWSASWISFQIIYERNLVPVWMPALLLCTGGIFMVLPILITHENISRTLIYGVVLNFFILSCQILFLWIYISSGVVAIRAIIMVLVYMTLYTYIQYTLLKSIKSFGSEQTPSGVEASQPDILGMLVRPQKLTEEEVSVAKEKKICLVCKGKVGGAMFMCTDCGTFYCKKCSEALSNIDNACWVCNTPFDESKPSKPFKKEEEKVEVEPSEKPEKTP